MWDLIKQLNIPYWLIISLLIGYFLILSGKILWKVYEFYGDTKKRNNDFDKFITNIKPFKDITENLENFIIRLCSAIKTKGDIFELDLYKKGSPLYLTEKGKNKLKEIGVIDDIDNGLNSLFIALDKLTPSSKLEVENYSTGVIYYYINDSKNKVFKKTSNYLYNNPEYNQDEFYKAAGLYLRDKYLEKHPEIT